MRLDIDFFGLTCIKFVQLFICRVVFYQIWGLFSHRFLKCSFSPNFFLLFFWDSKYKYWTFCYVSQVPESLLMFLLLLFLLIFYFQITSIILFTHASLCHLYNWAHPRFFLPCYCIFSFIICLFYFYHFCFFVEISCFLICFKFLKLSAEIFLYDRCLKSFVS